jgi:cbb3-type cytochrome oxidase maturation protein
MSVLFILVPLALLLAAAAAAGFVWSARHGQLDDLVTPALRVLGDDTPPASPAGCLETARSPAPDSVEACQDGDEGSCPPTNAEAPTDG